LVEGRKRQFLAAELRTPEGVAYAIEIERRGTGVGGRRNPESFALGVLVASQGRCFTLDDFDFVMKACIAEHGVWRKAIGEDIRVARLRHAYATCESFADAVVAAGRELLALDNEDNSNCEDQSDRVTSSRITA
jgi:hypothetical protein